MRCVEHLVTAGCRRRDKALKSLRRPTIYIEPICLAGDGVFITYYNHLNHILLLRLSQQGPRCDDDKAINSPSRPHTGFVF